MKKISILGSTGSIGTQTLEVIRTHADLFKAAVLSCGHNIELFREQLREFSPEFAVCAEEKDCIELEKEFPHIKFGFGMEALCAAAGFGSADITVNALLGMMGLRPTLSAVRAGKDIAFANKETLVAGGSLIMNAVREKGVSLFPVDSEHSAIFQCLQGHKGSELSKILLTASGGPFRGFSKEQLAAVSREQALKHPRWNMGAKISVDSATMMNKGLEIIEASLLFDISPSRIEVYVHPESVVHSAVEFADGAVIAQLGVPDMKLPIAYALSEGQRMSGVSRSLDLFETGSLHFERADRDVFRCLALAYEAISSGHSHQIAMNAANEEAVSAFLKDDISFINIASVVEEVLSRHIGRAVASIDDVFDIETESRLAASEAIKILRRS